MIINIQKDVQDLIDELNEIGESYIFGGYLRDSYLGFTPNDVDIVTNIPMDIIAERYGHLEKANKRKTISGHDVFSFKMHKAEKIFVEIVCTKSNLYEKPKQADYTLNSMMYRGSQLIDSEGALSDIKDKILREVDVNILQNDFKERPFLWLKTLRLVSMTGFDLTDNVYIALNNNKHYIKDISREILQTEGHKTLNGKFPLSVMELLVLMGFVTPFSTIVNNKVFDVQVSPQQKLCMLALLTNKQSVDDLIAFFNFPEKLKDKYEELYDTFHQFEQNNRIPNRIKHQIIAIKKCLA